MYEPSAEHERRLIRALNKLPLDVFERVFDSVVNGDEALATGAWIGYEPMADKPCGCLLFDGYGRKFNLSDAGYRIAYDHEGNYHGATDSHAYTILAEFYSVDIDLLVESNVVESYDEWARVTDALIPGYSILNTKGREAIRDILRAALAERKPVA